MTTKYFNYNLLKQYLDTLTQQNQNDNIITIMEGERSCQEIYTFTKSLSDSSNLSLLVKWNRAELSKVEPIVNMESCLAALSHKNFLLFDSTQDINFCNFQNEKLKVSDILKSNKIEFIAIRQNILQHIIKDFAIDCRVTSMNLLLFSAAAEGNIEIAKNAVVAGADINYFDDAGGTALYIASQR